MELATEAETIDRLYQERSLFLAEAADLPTNAGLVLRSPSSSALARLHSDGRAHLLDGDRHLFDVRGRSAEQRVALDLLSDDSVGIVSLGGPAGTGKSVLALAAGLEAVLERRTQKKVIVFRPLYAVGGQDLGFLPGDADDLVRGVCQGKPTVHSEQLLHVRGQSARRANHHREWQRGAALYLPSSDPEG